MGCGQTRVVCFFMNYAGLTQLERFADKYF